MQQKDLSEAAAAVHVGGRGVAWTERVAVGVGRGEWVTKKVSLVIWKELYFPNLFTGSDLNFVVPEVYKNLGAPSLKNKNTKLGMKVNI